MAYSDYGAFVYKNGERRRDKEDVGVFDTEEAEYGSGARIWMNLLKREAENSWDKPWRGSQHGVMGDGNVRVACYKQGFPTVWAWPEGAEEPRMFDNEQLFMHNGWSVDDPWVCVWNHDGEKTLCIDAYDYDDEIRFTVPGLEGYEFTYRHGEPNVSTMREPDGTFWECTHDYWYGAGFEDE